MQILAGNPLVANHGKVTRSMEISACAQFYTLDHFVYKQKSKENRNVLESRRPRLAMCALERPSRDTYKSR